MKHECGGTWEPLPRWNGRYRCNQCGVFGYRGVIRRGGSADKSGDIIPYKCAKRVGKSKCSRPAVARSKKKSWLCEEHQ